MPALSQSRHAAHVAQVALERARSECRSAARTLLIADLLDATGDRPQSAALHLSAQYEYDDEGGYFRWLHGTFTLACGPSRADDLEDCWTEGLEVDQEVVLELFGIDDVGEAILTRPQLESIAIESPGTPSAAGPRQDA